MATSPTHLIVVCCHAIYLGPEACNDESKWLIEPFQTGETGTYIAHVEAGVRELAADESALLVFSGGATKRDRTLKTEGGSYLDVAVELDFFGLESSSSSTLRPRMFVDRFATDSYQNILCSIIQFPLFARDFLENHPRSIPAVDSAFNFPTKLTIVSHAFKRPRFLNLHLPAMHWPKETRFIGIDPPFDRVKMAEIEQGDRLRGYGAWEKDLYGAQELLAAKRKARGWDEEQFWCEVLDRLPLTYRMQIERLLAWNGGQSGTVTYPGRVPWEED